MCISKGAKRKSPLHPKYTPETIALDCRHTMWSGGRGAAGSVLSYCAFIPTQPPDLNSQQHITL